MAERCSHYWAYEHGIYEGDLCVRLVRQCHKCLIVQVGKVSRWRRLKKGEFYPVPKPDKTDRGK